MYMYYTNLSVWGVGECVCGVGESLCSLLLRACIRVILRVHTGVLEDLRCLTVAQHTTITTFRTGPTYMYMWCNNTCKMYTDGMLQ